MSKPKREITKEQRDFIRYAIAEFTTSKDCYSALAQEYGSLSDGEFVEWCRSKCDYLYNHPNAKKFRAEAMELRAVLLADLSDIPIFHKRTRIREHAKLFSNCRDTDIKRKLLQAVQKECEGIEGNANLNDAKILEIMKEIADIDEID